MKLLIDRASSVLSVDHSVAYCGVENTKRFDVDLPLISASLGQVDLQLSLAPV